MIKAVYNCFVNSSASSECAVNRSDIKLSKFEVNGFVASCRIFMANSIIY